MPKSAWAQRPPSRSGGRQSIAALFLAVAVFFLALGRAAPAAAQQGDWVVNLTPYIWMQGVSGDLTARGRTATVDDNFFDLLDKSDLLLGGFVHLETRRGIWGGYLEGNFSLLETEETGRRGRDARVETRMFFGEAALFHQLADGFVADPADGRRWAIEGVAGARLVHFETEIGVGQAQRSNSTTWVDPIVGVRGQVDLDERWSLLAHADIGGFGVGSDFAANLYAVARVKFDLFGAPAIGSFGYRGLYFDVSNSGDNGAKLWIHGPILGLTFRL